MVLALTQAGGTYSVLLRASSDANLGTSSASGTFYAVEVSNVAFNSGVCSATLATYKVISGTATSLGATNMPCYNGVVVRAAILSNTVLTVYIDNINYFAVADSSITSGAPGISVASAPAANTISQVQFGRQDALDAYDYHWNGSQTNITVVTPAAGNIDPRQVGVRPLGSYWGAGSEQIDMRSGNVNYTVPLIKAMARGWGASFNLTYNSQNWRWDNGAMWKLGEDVGYGFSWELLAGSLTPLLAGPLPEISICSRTPRGGAVVSFEPE